MSKQSPNSSAVERIVPMFDRPMMGEQRNRAEVVVDGPKIWRVVLFGPPLVTHYPERRGQTLCGGRVTTPKLTDEGRPGYPKVHTDEDAYTSPSAKVCEDCRVEASRMRAVVA